jgi:hypothetical protein
MQELMSLLGSGALIELVIVASASIGLGFAISSFVDRERNQAEYL